MTSLIRVNQTSTRKLLAFNFSHRVGWHKKRPDLWLWKGVASCSVLSRELLPLNSSTPDFPQSDTIYEFVFIQACISAIFNDVKAIYA